MPYILSLVTFLPLVGALAIFLARLAAKSQDAAAPAARWIALLTTLVVLGVSVVLVAGFVINSVPGTNLGIGMLIGASLWNSWPRRVRGGSDASEESSDSQGAPGVTYYHD